MNLQTIVYALMTFLHDLFTVIWIGGLFVLGVSVLPAARKNLGAGPQTKKLMDAIQQRHSIWVYISMVGLIITGLLLGKQSAAFQGLFSFGNAYSAIVAIKHILVLAMIVIALYRSIGLKQAATPAQEKMKVSLLMLNIVLGVLVLLLSSFSAARSSDFGLL